MSTFILVLKRDANDTRWLARKWGSDSTALTSNCSYDPAISKFFAKNPSDQTVNCPCTKLTDPLGNSADVIMVKI